MKILDILNVLNYYRINGILIDFVCMLFIIKKELCCLIFKHFVVLFSDTLLFDFQTVLLGFSREGFDPNLDVDDCYGSDSDDEDLPDVLTPSRQGNHKGQRSLLDKIECQQIIFIGIRFQSKTFTLDVSSVKEYVNQVLFACKKLS